MSFAFPKAIDLRNMTSKTTQAIDWQGWYLQPKYDGCALVVSFDEQGVGTAVSASGKPVYSCGHIVEKLGVGIRNITFVAEVYLIGKPFQESSGAFRRQYPQPELAFTVFDAVSHGHEDASYHERHKLILSNYAVPNHVCLDKAYAEEYAVDYKAKGGYDGAIYRNPHAPWETGRSKGNILKIKPLATHDLLVLGAALDTGEKTGKNTAALLCKWRDNKVQKVATGLTQAQVDSIHADPECWAGKVIEVHGMGYTEDGMLREPRFKWVREDKTEGEF